MFALLYSFHGMNYLCESADICIGRIKGKEKGINEIKRKEFRREGMQSKRRNRNL
jgi:hypothetical protein